MKSSISLTFWTSGISWWALVSQLKPITIHDCIYTSLLVCILLLYCTLSYHSYILIMLIYIFQHHTDIHYTALDTLLRMKTQKKGQLVSFSSDQLLLWRLLCCLYFSNIDKAIKGTVHPKIKVCSYAHLNMSQDVSNVCTTTKYLCSFLLLSLSQIIFK